jgi:hypothetical protein
VFKDFDETESTFDFSNGWRNAMTFVFSHFGLARRLHIEWHAQHEGKREKETMSTLKQSMVFALGLALLTPGALMANELADQAKTRQEAVHLIKHIERTSLAIQKQADELNAMARTSQISNTTHKSGLRQIANRVNEDLQPAFSRLDELQPQLPDWKKSAIQEMRTSAADLAASTNAAILNRNPDGSRMLPVVDSDYRKLLSNIHERATALVEVADATADYGSAQLKGHQAGLAITSHD